MYVSNLATVTKKKTPFYRQANTIPYSGNMEILLGFLNKINSDDGYRITVKEYDKWSRDLSVKTVISAIKNGHTGMDVWAFIHPHYKKTINDNGLIRTAYFPYHVFSHWVMDLDNCGMSSIDEVLALYDKAGMQRPYCIVKTGPFNFHVFVWGVKEWNEYESRIAYILKLFDKNINLQNYEEVDAFLKTKGVDSHILSLETKWHKIRVPGSVNSKYSKPGQPFICEGWLNPYFNNAAEVVNSDIVPEIPKKERKRTLYKVAEVKKEIPERINQVIPLIEASLRNHFSRKVAKLFATYFAHNINYLSKFQMRISQRYLSKMFNIQQPTVSKHLKKLCKLGFLERDENYEKGKIAKRYKAGPKLNTLIMAKKQFAQEEEPTNIVHDDYVSGGSNDQMLSDIRYLYKNGANTEDIFKVCQLKMRNRPPIRRKSDSQIRCAIKLCENWNNSNGVSAPDIDLINTKKMIKQLEIIYENES